MHRAPHDRELHGLPQTPAGAADGAGDQAEARVIAHIRAGAAVGVRESKPTLAVFIAVFAAWTCGAFLAGWQGHGTAGALVYWVLAMTAMSPALAAMRIRCPRLTLVMWLTMAGPVTVFAGTLAAVIAILVRPRRADVMLTPAAARRAGISVWWPRRPARPRRADVPPSVALAYAKLMATALDVAEVLTADSRICMPNMGRELADLAEDLTRACEQATYAVLESGALPVMPAGPARGAADRSGPGGV